MNIISLIHGQSVTSCYFRNGTAAGSQITTQNCASSFNTAGPFLCYVYICLILILIIINKYFYYLKKVAVTGSCGSSCGSAYSCLPSSNYSAACGGSITSGGITATIYCCNTNNCNSASFLKSSMFYFLLTFIIGSIGGIFPI